MAEVRRYPPAGGKALLHLGRLQEGLDDRFVDFFAEQTHRHVVALRNYRSELYARDVKEIDMHGRTQVLLDKLLADKKLTDIGLFEVCGCL